MVSDAAPFSGSTVTPTCQRGTRISQRSRLGGTDGGGGVPLRSLDFKDDSSHQNCAEFMSTKVIGLVGQRLGVQRHWLCLVISDSMSASRGPGRAHQECTC
jgi:hypothetical protein